MDQPQPQHGETNMKKCSSCGGGPLIVVAIQYQCKSCGHTDIENIGEKG